MNGKYLKPSSFVENDLVTVLMGGLPMILDKVVEKNRELLHQRSQVGLNKYGTALATAGLTEEQILQHALEEALDLQITYKQGL